MKYRRLLAVVLVVLLLLTGCGGQSSGSVANKEAYDSAADGDAGAMGSTQTSQSQTLPQNQKLIRKVWLDAETEELDTLLTQIEERIGACAGYVENRQVYHGSNAELTVRIPADKLDSFLEQVGEAANVTSTREETEDVTLTYVATESKKLALETEQTRLLELLAQAQSMEDILKIESRLTELRSQLEELTSQLRVYDNLVSYSTVYLSVTEVREYTVVQEPETVWQRIGAGFRESWKNMCQGMEDLFVFAVCVIPYLLPLAVLAGVAILIVLLTRKKKK